MARLILKDNYSLNNEISLVKNGKELINNIIQMIEAAKRSIFFHMYIFNYDKSSEEIIKKLIIKSQEGVDVYLLIDGFGSLQFPQNVIEEMTKNYINFAFFSPVKVYSLNKIGRRLHQKVILIDSSEALIGGTNISQEFISPHNQSPWLDYACIIKGEEIAKLQKKIKRIYYKSFPLKKSSIHMLLSQPPSGSTGKVQLRVIENDYTRFKREIQKAYHRSIKNAKESIYITATYFLPGRKLLKLLKQAAARGVRVHLIFGDYSDIPSYNYGSMSHFSWYLKNKIKIYKWNQTVIHGKLALIDEQIVNIGSYNHNLISQYANLEMNVEAIDKEFAQLVKKEIDKIISESEEIDLEKYRLTGAKDRAVNFIAYLFSSILDLLQLLLIKK